MNPIVIFSVCLVLTTLSTCSGRPAESPTVGKYTVSKSNNDDGKYRPVQRNEGRYIHMVEPYVHVHDNRELGQYVHIPNPYDGGYGPYSGLNNPYRHDESGNYDKYTTTSTTTRRPTTTTTTTIKPRLFNYYEEGGWRILRQEEEKKKHKYDFLYHTENGIYGEEKANLHPGAGTAATGYYEYTGDDGELYRVNYKSDHRGFIPEGDHIPTPPPVPDAIKRALEYVAKKKETHGQVQTGQYEHKGDPIRRQNMPTSDRPLNLPQQPRVLPPLPSLGGALTQPQQPRPFAPLPSLSRPLTQPQLPRTLPPLPTLPPLSVDKPRFTQYSGSNQYNPLPTIVPQNAPQGAYQLPSLSSKRPADQLIQQTQLTQQSQPDKLPQVQVLLPQIQVPKPVQIAELAAPVVPLPQKIEVPEIKAIQPVPLPKIEPQVEEEQPQSDQPQSDQPQSDEPQQSDSEPLSKEEIIISGDQNAEQLDTDQSVESFVVVKPDDSEVETKIEPVAVSESKEISAEASEEDAKIEPEVAVSEIQETSAEASEVEAKIEPEASVSKNQDISADASDVDAKIEPEVAKEISAEASEVEEAKIEPVAASTKQEISAEASEVEESKIEPAAASTNQEISAEASEVEAKIEPEAVVSKKQEISAEASETENTFQPPFQVPEELKDKEDFELITA